MFWDNVEITVRAGDGGDGLISFRRELGEAKGGPDGGDGGDGGSVILVADRSVNTLAEYGRQRQWRADSGRPGGKAKKHGKSAADLELAVPVGTMIRAGDAASSDARTDLGHANSRTVLDANGFDERPLADLTKEGQRVAVAAGGRGGFGNAHFTSSTRQTPRQAELGEPGEQRSLQLELKLVADIGLVGIPSAGKSTLLSRITAAKPKIADYPFTTTVPQLGIATIDRRRLVIADIPGLIAGAHRGKGLGDAFLRHIERTKVMVHLLDATRPDPVADYQQIRRELESFSKALISKPEVIALNKIDTLDQELRQLFDDDLRERLGRPVRLISAVSGEGVREVLREVKKLAAAHRPSPTAAVPTFTLADLAPRAVSVTAHGRGFVLAGATIERLARQTDFANAEAAARFWWVCRRLGVAKQLEKLGAAPGAKLSVADRRLSWPG